VVVPVVIVEHVPSAAGAKSPFLMRFAAAFALIRIRTKGFFRDPVLWQRSTLPGLLVVVVVVVVVVPVVVVPVVVEPVVVVPVVVVVEPVVVVVVEPCCCVCVLASAIDVAKPATRSASRSALGFMMAAFLQGGCGAGLLV
jgi:hypothetical protein